MGSQYGHLTLEERCTIARLHEDGQSIRKIAAALDRPASTVSRELKRNGGRQVGYRPAYAQEQASARRWKGSRLERDAGLRGLVLDRLALGWSPEQVAGRLAREAGPVISHESIYRFIYAQARRTNDGAWRLYLPQARLKRGRRRRRDRSAADLIKGRVSIAQRPKFVQHRRVPGHWEADLMLFAKTGQALLVAHERTSRFNLLTRHPGKAADPTARQLLDWFERLPATLRRSVTFDNGTEFAQHQRLGETLSIKTFFCDAHSPWQKGGIENAIGRLRQRLPRKTNLDALEPGTLAACVDAYNHTPRKCLDFRSPAEAFHEQLLRFKCESTPSLRSG